MRQYVVNSILLHVEKKTCFEKHVFPRALRCMKPLCARCYSNRKWQAGDFANRYEGC